MEWFGWQEFLLLILLLVGPHAALMLTMWLTISD